VSEDYQLATSEGFIVYVITESDFKQKVYLGLAICGLLFLLLFRVWPEWIRIGVWYLSWYFLVLLVSEEAEMLIVSV
jgi:hypothetical protein